MDLNIRFYGANVRWWRKKTKRRSQMALAFVRRPSGSRKTMRNHRLDADYAPSIDLIANQLLTFDFDQDPRSR
jgi:hypothetical protein